MDTAADKEERKREYNRLAQREFRRRRKEHLKNLELAQKEQSSEKSEEIERLRYQNDELRRENEALRSQMYGPSSSQGLLSAPVNIPSISADGRAYSLSPSISVASLSGTGSPPASSLSAELMPMGALSLTSSMLSPSLLAYTDQALSSQQYSMVHPSGIRHNAQSSPESSGFRSSRSAVGSSFQPLNISQSLETHASQMSAQQGGREQSSSLVAESYDRAKARAEVMEIFRPLISDPTISTTPERHLAILRSMSDSLPIALKPSKAQLETPHYYGIDLLPSPSLRDRLLTVTSDVAQSFVTEIGITGGQREGGQLIIWGDDALNEMSWELSQPTLERWGWLLGREWVARTNFWRRQRGFPPLPDW